MPRDFGSGTCIHCGNYAERLTADHVLPEAWYSDSTPVGMEKWQAPSCSKCNSDYGKLERTLFQRLALGVEPWVVGGEGIGERALRSFDPSVAKSPKDRAHRTAAQGRMRRRMKNVADVKPFAAVLPNIGTIHEAGDLGYTVDSIELEELERLVEKFVRGMSYVWTGRVTPRTYVVHFIDPSKFSRAPDYLVKSLAEERDRGPCFRVVRHGTNDDEFAAFFRFFLWGKYEFWGALVRGDAPVAAG